MASPTSSPITSIDSTRSNKHEGIAGTQARAGDRSPRLLAIAATAFAVVDRALARDREFAASAARAAPLRVRIGNTARSRRRREAVQKRGVTSQAIQRRDDGP